jgi:hypothetical protein
MKALSPTIEFTTYKGFEIARASLWGETTWVRWTDRFGDERNAHSVRAAKRDIDHHIA